MTSDDELEAISRNLGGKDGHCFLTYDQIRDLRDAGWHFVQEPGAVQPDPDFEYVGVAVRVDGEKCGTRYMPGLYPDYARAHALRELAALVARRIGLSPSTER
jgi:hypothetical protein